MATGPYDLGPFQTLKAVNFAQGGWEFFSFPMAGFDDADDFLLLAGYEPPNTMWAAWRDLSESGGDDRFKFHKLNMTTKAWSAKQFNLGNGGALFYQFPGQSTWSISQNKLHMLLREILFPPIFTVDSPAFYTAEPLTNIKDWTPGYMTFPQGGAAYDADNDHTYFTLYKTGSPRVAELWRSTGGASPGFITNGPTPPIGTASLDNMAWNSARSSLWCVHLPNLAGADYELQEWDGLSWTLLNSDIATPGDVVQIAPIGGKMYLINGSTFTGPVINEFADDGSSYTELSNFRDSFPSAPLLGSGIIVTDTHYYSATSGFSGRGQIYRYKV